MKQNIFEQLCESTHRLFIHEPPYQTTVVCLNSVFCHGSLHMAHHAILYIRVGLTQANSKLSLTHTFTFVQRYLY